MMNTELRSNVNMPSQIVRPNKYEFTQNFLLVWLDAHIDENQKDFQKTLVELRSIVRSLRTFTDVDRCIEYLKSIRKEKIFLIISGSLGQSHVPTLHDMNQLDSIFVFCRDLARHRQWAQNWPKVQLVTDSRRSICERLKTVARECDQQTMPIAYLRKRPSSSASNNDNPDQLDPSFLYSLLFKEIALEIDYSDKKALEALVNYGRTQNIPESQLEYFQNEYRQHSPIWWYSSEIFLYSMLNKALYAFNVEVLHHLGFFIHHLHRQLDRLHKEQSKSHQDEFIVYRGQSFTTEDLQHLRESEGGLLSFNNFLSTSKQRAVAVDFMERSLNKYKKRVGLLFVMTIDPRKRSASTCPFALIQKYSAIPQEEEILFSMHSIFRIRSIRQSKTDSRIWEIQLNLTDDRDPDIFSLINHMRREISGVGWYRMGLFMLTLTCSNEAEAIFDRILQHPSSEFEEAQVYEALGKVKFIQEKYPETISCSEKAVEINRRIHQTEHPNKAKCYHHIGEAHRFMGNFLKSLEYHKRALEINKKVLKANDPDLASSYEATGAAYNSLGNHMKALEYVQKSIQMNEQNLPAHHPKLGWSYTNIAHIYGVLGQHDQALHYFQKALKINERGLPADHPNLGRSYFDAGHACDALARPSEALAYYDQAKKVFDSCLPPDHPDIALVYGSVAEVYQNTRQYSKALEFYRKALAIFQKVFPPCHPLVQQTIQGINVVQAAQYGANHPLPYHPHEPLSK